MNENDVGAGDGGDRGVGGQKRDADGKNGVVTRRSFVGGAATGALGASLVGAIPGGAGEREADDRGRRGRGRRSRRADVVVVGAGPAGLVAANKIAAAGRSVVVLEARDRVGGRVKNWHCGMPPACDCGQIIGPDHTRVRALARELGVTLYPQHATRTGEGNDVLIHEGQRFQTPAGNSRTIAAALARVPYSQIDSMASSVSPESPWQAARAAEWDATTVETWKRQNAVTGVPEFWVDFFVFLLGSCDPSDVSLLHLVGYTSRLGDGKRPGGTGQGLDFFFLSEFAEGGLQLIPDALAERLGRRVVLDAPVRRIAQSGRKLRVESDALNVQAKRVIVATAPSLNALIDFEPGLPDLRAQLLQRYPQGSMVTFAAIYERPFWRDNGFTGRAAGLDPAYAVLDNSPPDGSSGRLAVTVAGIRGRRHAQRPAQERERLMLDGLATYFGPEARMPMMTLERNWNGAVTLDAPWVDDVQGSWSRGCPGYLPPGVLLSFGPAIRAPFDRIHWANTEHSVSWNTYVEGAVRSAEAVADQVLAAL